MAGPRLHVTHLINLALISRPQVVRSCMQQRAQVGVDTVAHFSTTLGTFRHIWRTDHLRGFYRGIFAHVLRSTPQASITLLVYERVQRALTR